MRASLQRRVVRLERARQSHLTSERQREAFFAAMSTRELARRIALALECADMGLDNDWARFGFQAARILAKKD